MHCIVMIVVHHVFLLWMEMLLAAVPLPSCVNVCQLTVSLMFRRLELLSLIRTSVRQIQIYVQLWYT